jgi:hypothetical protein
MMSLVHTGKYDAPAEDPLAETLNLIIGSRDPVDTSSTEAEGAASVGPPDLGMSFVLV